MASWLALGKLAFQHRNLVRNAVKEGHDEVQARPKHRAQLAKAFDHMLFRLRHDAHPKVEADEDKECNCKIDARCAQKTVKSHDKPPV
jgi:hypothetical protein